MITAVWFGGTSLAVPMASTKVVDEVVYVESPVDTDLNGKLDRIYVQISRQDGQKNLPVIYSITPYAMRGNDVPFHDVNVSFLPQDISRADKGADSINPQYLATKAVAEVRIAALERGYANISAHSLGTGNSSGCPTVGDAAEMLAAKAVIDWLNGRARGFNESGSEIFANWASGAVGMTGASYDGTLPNMVATTGVEGLKAIIPIAAISSWYNYYRANGLVVGPGGYVGEDADILGKHIVRRGNCNREMNELTRSMGRENGDFTNFWRARDYVSRASNVRAAVFIMHGQNDWNVRQRHAIEWWEALEDVVPRRMWLHRGGHTYPNRPDLSKQIWAWFDRFVKGEANNVELEPAVEVQSPTGEWTIQNEWPNERTIEKTFYLNEDKELSAAPGRTATALFVDKGKSQRIESVINDPTVSNEGRLAFVTGELASESLLSGTPRVKLRLALQNRSAVNLTVLVVDYDRTGKGRVVTRGWADPQNYADPAKGELLEIDRLYDVSFKLEPKQHKFAAGHRIGIVVGSTDYDHTLRPNEGTRIAVTLGSSSYIELGLSGEHVK